jgi:hypothetical protein
MITRLRRAWAGLATEQRRVVLAAALVLVSLLLPWYSKTTNAITRAGLDTRHEAKMAITVPSFVEASIFLVAIAVLVLMLTRGEGRAFHLPFGDGGVVTAAGAWVGFLVFYRFVDQPAGDHTENLTSEYGLSWGIFFGLLAAAFLLYSGLRLRAAAVPEPPLPGDGPGSGPAGGSDRSTAAVSEREARRQRRAAEREAAREAARAAARERDAAPPRPAGPASPPRDERDPPTTIAPPPQATSVTPGPPRAPTTRRPQRSEIDGGEQLSFDEQE